MSRRAAKMTWQQQPAAGGRPAGRSFRWLPFSRRPTARAVLGIGVAVALTLLANFWFTREVFTRTRDVSPLDWGPRQVWGVWALLAAIVTAAGAFSRRDEFAEPPTRDRRSEGRARRANPWIFAGVGFAAYLAAAGIYLARGETLTVRILWAASVLCVAGAGVRFGTKPARWGLPFREFAAVAGITLVAFAARYVELTTLPFNLDVDLGIMGFLSRLMVENHDWRLIGMAPTMHQYSEHQILATSLRIFGSDHRGLVMLSVLAGTATVPVLYFLGKLLCNPRVGFAAAALLATDYVHLHFSRLMFGPVATFFVMAGSLALLHGIRRERLGGFVLGESCSGWASSTITPAASGPWCWRRFLSGGGRGARRAR